MVPRTLKSAFLFFQTNHLANIRQELKPRRGEAVTELTRRWRILSEPKRSRFDAMEAKERQRFDEESAAAGVSVAAVQQAQRDALMIQEGDPAASRGARQQVQSEREDKMASRERETLLPLEQANPKAQEVRGRQAELRRQETEERRKHRQRRRLDSSATTATVTNTDSIERATLDQWISEAADQSQTSVSLQAMIRTAQGEYLHRTFGEETVQQHAATELVLVQVASFLRRELPIRLAHRIQGLQSVPLLSEMTSVVTLQNSYRKSFSELASFPSKITTVEQDLGFAKVVEGIYERHSNFLVQMARGAFEFRQAVRDQQGQEYELQQETHEFLDRFYVFQIGIRVLIGQYLALRQPPVPNHIGIICSHTSPYETLKRAIDFAACMCTRQYGQAPDVIVSGRLDVTFPYVPTYLHIFWELLKNSMRATVERHGVDADYPPIRVVIADGDENESVVIKVSDEGGGIPRSNMSKIWSYLFTTSNPSIQEGMFGSQQQKAHDHGVDSSLGGLGIGLPISRSYCRYFGGDLSVMSMEGYGTDAFVYLSRLGNSSEPLPI